MKIIQYRQHSISVEECTVDCSMVYLSCSELLCLIPKQLENNSKVSVFVGTLGLEIRKYQINSTSDRLAKFCYRRTFRSIWLCCLSLDTDKTDN